MPAPAPTTAQEKITSASSGHQLEDAAAPSLRRSKRQGKYHLDVAAMFGSSGISGGGNRHPKNVLPLQQSAVALSSSGNSAAADDEQSQSMNKRRLLLATTRRPPPSSASNSLLADVDANVQGTIAIQKAKK